MRRPMMLDLRQLKVVFTRLWLSTVVWSWVFNFFRLAAGLILLPLVVSRLSTADLGMYYVLLSLTALVPLVDFGLSPNIGRFICYAMGGAESIQAHGVPKPGKTSGPNYALLWELLFATRTLYRFLGLAVFVVLGAWGTYMVEMRIGETSSTLLTRLAWGVTLVASILDIYSGWWINYLRNMNEVRTSVCIALVGVIVRLVLAAVMLICGFGLLSLPLGTFVSTFIQRGLARRRCQQLLSGHAAPARANLRQYLRILWPNTWRTGLLFVSGYLTVNANTAICLYVLGLKANAIYGLSAQLLGILSGMVAVWTSVKWPMIVQHQARHDYDAVIRILRPRVWLQNLTFLAGAATLLSCGPLALSWLGSGKQMLPRGWLAVMALNCFFDMHYTLWTTVISTENKLPFLWPAVAGNVLSLALSLTLIHFTSLGLGALVLGPLLAGSLFNYWYWPLYAARGLGTNLMRLMLFGHRLAKSALSPARQGERQ